MTYNQSLYTQKDLVDMLELPRQTLSRYLPEDSSFLINSGTGHKVKAYPLNVLPEDWRRQLIAFELDAQEEARELTPKYTGEVKPPKRWQQDVCKARMLILHHIKCMALSPDDIPKAEKEFARLSQSGELSADIAEIVSIATAKSRSKGVSYSTLRSWRTLLKKYGPDGLTPINAQPPKMAKWMAGFLKVWQLPGCPSIKHVYDRLVLEGAELPSLRTVEREIKKLGKFEAGKGRETALALKAVRLKNVRTTDDLLPTDIYVSDGKTAQFYVQHLYTGKPFRPELVTIIDVKTRVIVGFAAGLAENQFTTLEALMDSMSNYGVPAVFYSDRGSGYKNKMLDDPVSGIMVRLGIEKKLSLPRHPQSKGVIERINSTVWNKYGRMLKTFVEKKGSSYEFGRDLNVIRKEIDEHGTSKDLMSWERFLEWAREVIHQYNNSPHSSLPKVFDDVLNKYRHSTPAELWRSLKSKANIIKPPQHEIENMARPQEVRVVRNGWISLDTKKYFHRDLDAYHMQQVLVGYDINDASKVWIRNLDEQLVCVAEINANARAYIEKTKMELYRDNRENRAIKLLNQQIADKQVERRGQQVIDISPELKAEIVEFREEFAKPKFVRPDSDLEKYKLCLALAEKPNLSPEEQEFYEVFTQSRGFKEGETEYYQRENFRRTLAANQ